jgi:adenylate kinase family enzyme
VTGVRRICLVGNSGSGKTTLGRQIAARLGLVRIELDSLYHRPGWQESTRDQLRVELVPRLQAAEAAGGWVVDGNYVDKVSDLTVDVADTVVWLDLPRSLVVRQVTGRTVGRLLTRQELWNGNRESLRNVVSMDPRRSIVRWSWTQHDRYRDEFGALASASSARWIRVRSRADRASVLDQLRLPP